MNELADAFARNPRLPKFLKANVVVDTIAQGIGRGLFVAELARPDGSRRTWWREAPPREVMEDGQLRVAPPVASAPPATSLEGHQVQDLADLVPDLLEASAGYRLEFQVRAVLTDAPDEVRARVERLIDTRLKPGPGRPSRRSANGRRRFAGSMPGGCARGSPARPPPYPRVRRTAPPRIQVHRPVRRRIRHRSPRRSRSIVPPHSMGEPRTPAMTSTSAAGRWEGCSWVKPVGSCRTRAVRARRPGTRAAANKE